MPQQRVDHVLVAIRLLVIVLALVVGYVIFTTGPFANDPATDTEVTSRGGR